MDKEMLRRFESIATEIYEAGKRDGRAEVRAAFLNLVSNDMPVGVPVPLERKLERGGRSGSRAPRGALEAAIHTALLQQPGQTEQALEEVVSKIDPRISPRSVGGQLRRFKGVRYRQDGRHWFLLESGETEKAGPVSGPASNPLL